MKKEIIEYKGFIGTIIYQPFFDDSTPKSKQYKLIITKDGEEYINRYGLTEGGALTLLHRWVDKKLEK